MKTAGKTNCTNQAKVYNEEAKQWVCGIHDNMIKASGICVICLEMMDNPSNRTRLVCKHVLHKECASHLDTPCCPVCRTGISDKYAKRLFTNTKASPLMDNVFNLAPEKQKAFFDISGRVLEILDSVDPRATLEEIMLFKTSISNFAFGMKTLNKMSGGINARYGVLADWCDASATAFSHLSEYDSYDGLEMFAENTHFWVESRPRYDDIVMNDVHIPATDYTVDAVQQSFGVDVIIPPPIITNVDYEEYELSSPTLLSPVSPSVIR
jgi:hypothetical protein